MSSVQSNYIRYREVSVTSTNFTYKSNLDGWWLMMLVQIENQLWISWVPVSPQRWRFDNTNVFLHLSHIVTMLFFRTGCRSHIYTSLCQRTLHAGHWLSGIWPISWGHVSLWKGQVKQSVLRCNVWSPSTERSHIPPGEKEKSSWEVPW